MRTTTLCLPLLLAACLAIAHCAPGFTCPSPTVEICTNPEDKKTCRCGPPSAGEAKEGDGGGAQETPPDETADIPAPEQGAGDKPCSSCEGEKLHERARACDGTDSDCDGTSDEGIIPPQGTPRIVEVMANPPTGQSEFIEIENIHPANPLNLCALSLSDGGSSRKIVHPSESPCPALQPGQIAIIVEPDYDRAGNPYKIPKGVPVFTVAGSTTTLFSGGLSSGEPVRLLSGVNPVDEATPGTVAGGAWPGAGTSLEKCEGKVENKKSNWREGAIGGSPGKPNGFPCP